MQTIYLPVWICTSLFQSVWFLPEKNFHNKCTVSSQLFLANMALLTIDTWHQYRSQDKDYWKQIHSVLEINILCILLGNLRLHYQTLVPDHFLRKNNLVWVDCPTKATRFEKSRFSFSNHTAHSHQDNCSKSSYGSCTGRSRVVTLWRVLPYSLLAISVIGAGLSTLSFRLWDHCGIDLGFYTDQSSSVTCTTCGSW